MAVEPVEVAIESALLTKAQAFAAAQSPALAISLPNVAFTPPPSKTVVAGKDVPGKWLRASFLPAPSFETGISWNAHAQHYGIMELDVFYAQGAGEYAPGRFASQIIQYFARGTEFTKDGFRIRITKQPYRGSLLKDDPWQFIPVSIPYLCFARP